MPFPNRVWEREGKKEGSAGNLELDHIRSLTAAKCGLGKAIRV